MPRPRSFQFGLRTLLAAMLVLGMLPWAVQCWRDEQAWQALESARQRCDQALIDWRSIYELTLQDEAPSAATSESPARARYFAARQQLKTAEIVLRERYAHRPGGLERATQDRRSGKQ